MKINTWQRGLLLLLFVGVALMFGGYVKDTCGKDKGKDREQGSCLRVHRDKGEDKAKAGLSSIPNNHPFNNPGGKVATFSTQGAVNLTGNYFIPLGTNGRSCVTCHLAEDSWGISACTVQQLFDETDGTHPIFNLLDADNPN